MIGLYLCIIEVVRFSNKVGLKGKVFEVVSFSLSCFVFISYLGFNRMQMIR